METPQGPGRKPKGRIRTVVYLDPPIAAAIKDFGYRSQSDAANALIRLGLNGKMEESTT